MWGRVLRRKNDRQYPGTVFEKESLKNTNFFKGIFAASFQITRVYARKNDI